MTKEELQKKWTPLEHDVKFRIVQREQYPEKYESEDVETELSFLYEVLGVLIGLRKDLEYHNP